MISSKLEPMREDGYSVHWWDSLNVHHIEYAHLSIDDALQLAFAVTKRPAALIGIINQVSVHDASNLVVWEWKFSRGVVVNRTTPPPRGD